MIQVSGKCCDTQTVQKLLIDLLFFSQFVDDTKNLELKLLLSIVSARVSMAVFISVLYAGVSYLLTM